MTASEKEQEVTGKGEPVQPGLFAEGDGEDAAEGQPEPENRLRSAAEIRTASYFVLTIAAVFVINAMETGSYRTPWPVAIVVTLAGLGLLAYSFVKSSREGSRA